MTWQLARRSTVTGTCSPPSVKTRVIPTFCAITPERMRVVLVLFLAPVGSELDLDVDAGGEIELHQRVHRLRRRIDDVEQTLVGAHLELLAALLVDMRRAVDGEFLDLGRQRNRAAHLSARALGGRHDLARRRIEDAVIERLEPDPDVLTVHELLLHGKGARSAPLFPLYSVIDTTTPAPTVLPPSRMAKRCFSSMAIGVISSTSMAALSPGMIISVPAGSVHWPVTSVVRK